MSRSRELAELATAYDSGGSFAFRNRIINGQMMIDQRNAGASVTPTNGQFVTDRWKFSLSQTSKFTAQQNQGSVTPPVGFSNYLGLTSSSSYSSLSSDYFWFEQDVEGLNFSDLAWGTANAQAVTLSFKVYSSITGTWSGSIANSAQDRSYPFSYTVSSANTWTTVSVTIAGDTSGTWLTTNGIGARIRFDFGTGSTYRSTAGSWQAGQYLGVTSANSLVGTSGATFYITGVQLEKGSTATSFDYRPYGTELALCQRYCIKYSANTNSSYTRFGIGEAWGTTTADLFIFLPVEMRTNSPSITTTGTASNYALYSAGGIIACSGVPTVSGASTEKVINLAATVASGLVGGRAVQFIANNSTTAFITFSAEL